MSHFELMSPSFHNSLVDTLADTGYTVGDYLLDRLAELGVTEIFGVPGDYQLEFLDHILAHPRGCPEFRGTSVAAR